MSCICGAGAWWFWRQLNKIKSLENLNEGYH